jgi:hypothetical protein
MDSNNNLSEYKLYQVNEDEDNDYTIPSFYITNTCYKTHTVVQPFIENTANTINNINAEKVDNIVDNELNIVEKVDYELNTVCLITGDLLESDSIRLECGHKFNYMPLLNDLIEYKKHMDNTYSKRIKTIRCPYCRQIQHKLIPYYDTYNIKACNVNMSEEEFVFNLKKEKEDKEKEDKKKKKEDIKKKKEEEKKKKEEEKKKRDEAKKQKEEEKKKRDEAKKKLPKSEKSVL